MSNMSRRTHDIFIRILAIAYVVIAFLACLILYRYFHNMKMVFLCAMVFLLGGVIIVLMHHIDDMYISGIVSDLSRLTDILIDLEEKDIFPENEDSLVSKLQSKVIKLARILKKQKENEILEHENIKSLVSDISHQLKTPIANLKMYSHFLEDDSLSETTRKEYIDIIRISVDRLNFLSESMIKISRLESNLIHLNVQEQKLNETILQAVKNVYVTARRKGTEIIYEEEAEIIVPHDRNWTAEAVFNLLDNAVKYSTSGSHVVLSIK